MITGKAVGWLFLLTFLPFAASFLATGLLYYDDGAIHNVLGTTLYRTWFVLSAASLVSAFGMIAYFTGKIGSQ